MNNSFIHQPLNITFITSHLKLLSKATVGVGLLFPVVSLVVLHPHSHTPAHVDNRRQPSRIVQHVTDLMILFR